MVIIPPTGSQNPFLARFEAGDSELSTTYCDLEPESATKRASIDQGAL